MKSLTSTMRGLPLSKRKVLFNAVSFSPVLKIPLPFFSDNSGLWHFSFTVFSRFISHSFFCLTWFSSCFRILSSTDVGDLIGSCCLLGWPELTLFTLGRIFIKLALSLLLPSITNSVCLCRAHFPPSARPFLLQ